MSSNCFSCLCFIKGSIFALLLNKLNRILERPAYDPIF